MNPLGECSLRKSVRGLFPHSYLHLAFVGKLRMVTRGRGNPSNPCLAAAADGCGGVGCSTFPPPRPPDIVSVPPPPPLAALLSGCVTLAPRFPSFRVASCAPTTGSRHDAR